MRVLHVHNVHTGLAYALQMLDYIGYDRDSRNGKVKLAPMPVATVFQHPCQRVVFWPERDANPFFHLYESLWMLAGRNDIQPLTRFAKNMANYSDDGVTQHGAYGHRWRNWFPLDVPVGHTGMDPQYDQLAEIVKMLKKNPDERRAVLQMWDAETDLNQPNRKDVPCNTMATFQIGKDGELNLSVFCRSNDIVWGCYGANAVHFSMLLEYMACWLQVPVGTYTQISVNWHGYHETLKGLDTIRPDRNNYVPDPYENFSGPSVRSAKLFTGGQVEQFDSYNRELLNEIDSGFITADKSTHDSVPFWGVAWRMMRAHAIYKATNGLERYDKALEILDGENPHFNDWLTAGCQWILRRKKNAMNKMMLGGELSHP